MNERTLTDQARRGEDVVEYYHAQEQAYDFEDFRVDAVDVMADILHALRARGHDPRAALEMAHAHFLAEISENARQADPEFDPRMNYPERYSDGRPI